jgi:hypothetical protein
VEIFQLLGALKGLAARSAAALPTTEGRGLTDAGPRLRALLDAVRYRRSSTR